MEKQEAQKRRPHTAAYRGWKEVGGFQKGDELTPTDNIMDLLTKSTVLEEILPGYLYGDWYHIVAIIIVGSLLCWLLGHYGFFLGPVFFVTFPAAMYYRSCVRKYRHSIRMEAQREFSVSAIEDDFESLDWMNVFLEKLWPHLEPYISEQVCEQGNAIMADLPIPAFVKQVWIHTFTVGTKSPRVDKVRTLSRTGDDVTVMDWWVSFTPNVSADLTEKQLKSSASQEMVIKAKLFGMTIPFSVSNATFKAKIRVRLHMMANFPHIQTVNVSLMEPPYFDAITKPIGGSSIFCNEVFSIPGLYMFLNELVLKFAGPMLFSPLSFQLNLEQMLAGNGLRGALGILELTVKDAKGLKGADTFNNTIDPYFTFGFGGKVLAKTKIVPDTTDPVYNETINVMINTTTEPLAIILYDENESDGRRDKFMGATLYDLEDIMAKGTIKDITLPILRNNRPAGQITFGLKMMKSLQGSKLPDGSYLPPPDLNTGVLNFKLLGARAYSKNEKKPESVFAEVFIEREKMVTSGVVKGANEATWDMSVEKIVTDRSHCNVRVVLKDANKNAIGSSTLRLTDIIDGTYVGNDWYTLSHGIGDVRMSCEWNSVHMTGVAGSIGYTEPIGVVRIHVTEAKKILNLEKIGTVDPYVRIMVNGVERGRTITMASTVNPVFNESIYVPVSSPNQTIVIEAMSSQRTSRDRTLGSFNVRLDKFINYDEKNTPLETIGDADSGLLVHNKKGAHGTVSYSMAFFPCKSVRTPVEAQERKQRISNIKQSIDDEKVQEKNITEKLAEREKKRNAKISRKVKKFKKQLEQAQDQLADLNDELQEIQDQKPREELTPEMLTNYDSGVLVFSILDGQFSSEGYVQVFFDKQGYATLTSNRVGSGKRRVAATGDAFIKELSKYSIVTIKLAKNAKANIKKEGVEEVTLPTLQFLSSCYDQARILKLGSSQIRVRARFIPVIISSLPMADSIGNSGTLYLRVSHATGLPAGDSNGKSDPFAKFYIGDDDFFKTKTKKKTLNPEWNEETEVNIDYRVVTNLRIVVSDWDFGVEQNDKLGECTYSLADLDPFAKDWKDLQLSLADDNNKPAGQIFLQARFKPEYHTLLDAEKPMPNVGDMAVGGAGKLIGTGVGGAGKVIGTAGKVLGSATGIFRRKK